MLCRIAPSCLHQSHSLEHSHPLLHQPATSRQERARAEQPAHMHGPAWITGAMAPLRMLALPHILPLIYEITDTAPLSIVISRGVEIPMGECDLSITEQLRRRDFIILSDLEYSNCAIPSNTFELAQLRLYGPCPEICIWTTSARLISHGHADEAITVLFEVAKALLKTGETGRDRKSVV